MKCKGTQDALSVASRAPHGARGLKLRTERIRPRNHLSRPTRGAWIEIHAHRIRNRDGCVAPHTGRVD